MTSVQICPTLSTVYYFFGKIVEIKRFALLAAILDECQNQLSERGMVWEEARKIFFSPPFWPAF